MLKNISIKMNLYHVGLKNVEFELGTVFVHMVMNYLKEKQSKYFFLQDICAYLIFSLKMCLIHNAYLIFSSKTSVQYIMMIIR